MTPLPCLQIYPRPPVTLTFDLLTPKVDRFMPLPRGSFAPICIKISSFMFTSTVTDEKKMDKQIDGWITSLITTQPHQTESGTHSPTLSECRAKGRQQTITKTSVCTGGHPDEKLPTALSDANNHTTDPGKF